MRFSKITSAMLAATLAVVLAGCGEEGTTCRVDVQTAIDTGDWDRAISLLDGECATAFTDSDRNYNLAAAYMGKSGFGVSDVVNLVLDASNNSGSAFTSFARSLLNYTQPDSLALLEKSREYFLDSIDQTATSVASVCTPTRIDADTRVRNACLYIAFDDALKTATTITYLTQDVVAALDSIDAGSGTLPDDMKASIDALAWAVGQTEPNGSSITDSNVTIAGGAYKHLEVDLSGNGSGPIFYRLATTSAPSSTDPTASTVVTDGYCDVNGDKTPCAGIENSDGSIDTAATNAGSCYACPVLVDNTTPQSVTQTMVDALNDALQTTLVSTSDPDIQQSIQDFVADIEAAGGGTVDGTITVDELINYLNQ